MKKLVIMLAMALVGTVASMASDIKEAWARMQALPDVITADAPAAEIAKDGFTSLKVSVNPAPTDATIASLASITKSIDGSQLMADTVAQGFDVKIYCAAANAGGSEYNVLFVIYGGEADKVQVAMYGTCTAQALQKAISSLSIENVLE